MSSNVDYMREFDVSGYINAQKFITLSTAPLTKFFMNHSKQRYNRIGDIEGVRRASELFGFLLL